MTDSPPVRKARVVLRPRNATDPRAVLDEAFAVLEESDYELDAGPSNPRVESRVVPDEQLETHCREEVQRALDDAEQRAAEEQQTPPLGRVPQAEDKVIVAKDLLKNDKGWTIAVRMAQLTEMAAKGLSWILGGPS